MTRVLAHQVRSGCMHARLAGHGQWRVLRASIRVGRYHAEGEYREITPPERLVYTHCWLTDDPPVETLITVEFLEEGEGTRVVMVHEGFLSDAARKGHEEGWTSCFDRLERLFA